MADSDSDFDDDDDEKGAPPAKKSKKQASYIQEDPESIVDLADVNAIGRITSIVSIYLKSFATKLFVFFPIPATNPLAKTGNPLIDKQKKAKDANRGFKTAGDGRLIIAEPKRGEAMSDSDDDFDVEDAGGDAAAKNSTGGTKRTIADDSDSDDETADQQPSRKRKATDLQSMASGRTGASSRYIAGGRGIHRPTGGAASVKSSTSRMSAATTKSASTAFGGAFKAKKAKGDMKSKGKLDPYAYIPLSRNSLNKRLVKFEL